MSLVQSVFYLNWRELKELKRVHFKENLKPIYVRHVVKVLDIYVSHFEMIPSIRKSAASYLRLRLLPNDLWFVGWVEKPPHGFDRPVVFDRPLKQTSASPHRGRRCFALKTWVEDFEKKKENAKDAKQMQARGNATHRAGIWRAKSCRTISSAIKSKCLLHPLYMESLSNISRRFFLPHGHKLTQ